MSNSYNPPVDTVDVLHIDCEYETFSFGKLFQRMVDHFGSDIKLNDFEIEATKIKVRGCNCCSSLDDYTDYIRVTRLTQPASDTETLTIQGLITK
uniref:Uncharacterized protein n=1 Tax=Pseudomonas phage vB_PaeM_FBPa36 TaxID=3231237 RepID=A0AAU8KSS7_9VIRU